MNMDFWILTAELLFIPLLLNIIFIVSWFKNRKNKKKILENLKNRMIETKPNQEKMAQDFFGAIGVEEENSHGKLKGFNQVRNNFVIHLMDGVLHNDHEKLSDLVDQYNETTTFLLQQEINASGGVQEAPSSTEGESSSESNAEVGEEGIRKELETSESKVSDLQSENKDLKREIHKTLKTLNNIFAEYSSMFGEEVNSQDMTAEEIVEAMSAFSKRALGTEDTPASGDVDVSDDSQASTSQVAEDTADASVDNEESFESEENAESEEATPVSQADEEAAMPDIEQEAETSEGEEDPSWDDAFAETDDFNDEEQPSWDDAFAEESTDEKK
ncbi:MAG: hypothetical protein AAGB12_01150 [Pseudomonadota bacterium]